MGVDVGIVCLRLGPVGERRGVARKLAAELIQRADKLMYAAKSQQSPHVHSAAVRVVHGELTEMPTTETIVRETHARRRATDRENI